MKQVSFERTWLIFSLCVNRSTQKLLHGRQYIFLRETWTGWSHAALDLQRSKPRTPESSASHLQCFRVELDESLPSCSPIERSHKDSNLENGGATRSQICLRSTFLGTSFEANPSPFLKCAQELHLAWRMKMELWISSSSWGKASFMKEKKKTF